MRELTLARRLDTPCKDVVKHRREGYSSADILIELVISKQKVKGTSAPSFQAEITRRIDVLVRVLAYSPCEVLIKLKVSFDIEYEYYLIINSGVHCLIDFAFVKRFDLVRSTKRL